MRDHASGTLLTAYLDAEIGRIGAQSDLRYAETRRFIERVEVRLRTTEWRSSDEIRDFLRASREDLRSRSTANHAQHEADLVQYRAEAKKRIAEYYRVSDSSHT